MSDLTRLATRSDAGAVGQLLYDFNEESGEPTPMPGVLAERIDRPCRTEAQRLFW